MSVLFVTPSIDGKCIGACGRLFLLLLGLSLTQPVQAAYLNANISVTAYTDFGQNKGRYQTGATNALLQHLNAGGAPFPPVDGVSSGTLPQEMVSFQSQVDKGNSVGIGYNFIATAQHLGLDRMGSPTFSARVVGAEYAIRYAAIEYSSTNDLNNDRTFLLTPEADYKISRLSKLITDVATSAVYRSAAGEAPDLTGTMLYGSTAGDTYTVNANGNASYLAWWGKNPDGWMMEALGAAAWNGEHFGTEDERGCTDDSFFFQMQVGSWGAEGVTESQPLPIAGCAGDSGSPVWVYNADTGRYEYLGALEAAENRTTQGTGAGNWTCETMESFDREVLCEGESTIFLQSVVHQDSETLTDASYNASTTPWRGTVTREDGALITDFIGVQDGLHTWLSLNGEMDKEAWYAYGNEYLNASTTAGSKDLTYADLFMTENLVFRAGTEAEVLIRLEGNVDLGIGYVEFSAGERERASFVLASGGEGDYLLDSAGYVVGQGVELTLKLTNEADYAREWRKVGEGTLRIGGEGDNYVALNLGGTGDTWLERSGGYAAYNVLANSGAVVVLSGGTGQIARDFTFGNGGGELDFHGHSMEWNNETAGPGTGRFSIHALTEEAVVSNRMGGTTSVLTFTQRGEESFQGSFVDTAESALVLRYDGGTGSSLLLTGIRTSLQHEDSGLEVASGRVRLAGTMTEHALGSAGVFNSTERYASEDDWHYADAQMNVTVGDGAVFELDSHARLTGTVTVQEGGTYLMREAVRHQYEYIEGWYEKENTDAIRDYVGHKGETVLEAGATLEVRFHEGVTAETQYSGSLSGAGELAVHTGSEGGSLRLDGDLSDFFGDVAVEGGRLILGQAALEQGVAAGVISVAEGASLSLEGGVQLSAREGETASLSGAVLSRDAASSSLSISGKEGESVRLSQVSLSLEDGAVLHLRQAVLEAGSRLTGATVATTEAAAAALSSSSATLVAEGVTVQLSVGLNATAVGEVLEEDMLLAQTGKESASLTLEAGSRALQVSSDALEGLAITGSSLTLEGIAPTLLEGYDFLCVAFTNGENAASFADPQMELTAWLDGHEARAWVLDDEAVPTALWFDLRVIPEPATTLLSLLAGVFLTLRRRRPSETKTPLSL